MKFCEPTEIWSRLLHYYWPLHEFRSTEDLPDHQVEAIRMKNRWRLERLRPYFSRWFLLICSCGIIAALGNQLPYGPIGFLVYMVGVVGILGTGGVIVFWAFIYSMRPH